MEEALRLFLLLPILAISIREIQTTSNCPWDNAELQRWSEDATWPSKQKPVENDQVFIPADKKILLDTPIPRLLSLTINGTLVWGNVDGIRMETSYVLVNGEFHIGSEECNFEKTADIFLYGKSNSHETVPGFGRKFLGAAPGSKLEIHGKQKKSWTKLVATVSPVTRGPCGIIYDSRDETNKRGVGIWVNQWNSDGTPVKGTPEIFDLTGSKAENNIPKIVNRIEQIPSGMIVAIAVQKTIGSRNPPEVYENLYGAIESLGGYSIRDVEEYDPYVVILEKGNLSSAEEKHSSRPVGIDNTLEASVTFTHGELAFYATSYTEVLKNKDDVRFRVLHRNAAFPKLSFLHDVTSWQPGDEVVVVSTDYDWRQFEVKTIDDCDDCEPNQIRVKGDFKYSHFGEVTYGVDERGEVGLLSRNIRIDAELQDVCYSYTEKEEQMCEMFNQKDTFGGHTKVIGGAWARIEGVQLTNMGQQSVIATYPLHFHLADAVPGQYLRNNVIRDSNSRCITIHGTDYLHVSDNVCLNHLGHGVFLEDSAEQNNTIHRNLIIGTQYGSLLPTDMDANNRYCPDRSFCALLSTFWITHPNNYFTENVAAGSDGSGFVFAFSDRPLGPSLPNMIRRNLYVDKGPRYMKVPEFTNNTAHSNALAGVWFDNMLSYGQMDMGVYVPENGKMGLNHYSPTDTGTPDGAPTETVLSRVTLYKNEERNAWVRGGNVVIASSSFADSPVSYVGAHTTGGTYTNVRDSIFIGETDNKGEPYTHTFHDKMFQHLPKFLRPKHHFDRSIAKGRPDFMISGVQFYQGPMYVNNSFFDGFKNWYYNDSFMEAWNTDFRPLRPAAAITFHQNNHYPSVPRNGVHNIKFGFCDGKSDSFRVMDSNASTPWWGVFDGTENIIFRDYDGSLTTNENAVIVNDRPFFTGPRCTPKPNWGLTVCPYKYSWMVIKGSSGVLKKQYKGKTPVLISRDDVHEDVYKQTGSVGHKFNLRMYKSYTVKFNKDVGPAPRDVQFRPRFGLEKKEVVRFAVCFPNSTTSFTIYSKYPELHPKREQPLWVDSLQKLDKDKTMKAFYWDQLHGYLYFKMSSPYSFTKPGQECAGDVCLEVNIRRDDGDDTPTHCETQTVQPYYFKDRYPFVKHRVCLHPDSSEGLGAPIESGFAPPPVTDQTCQG